MSEQAYITDLAKRMREAFRRFDQATTKGEWDEVAYDDLWECVKDLGRYARSLEQQADNV